MSKKKTKPYFLRLALAVDQMANVLGGRFIWGPFAGDEDETISSCLGKLKVANKGKIPWRYPIAKLTDWCLEKIDKNHSVDAIEHDEGKNP
jgi:hypothetical protein